MTRNRFLSVWGEKPRLLLSFIRDVVGVLGTSQLPTVSQIFEYSIASLIPSSNNLFLCKEGGDRIAEIHSGDIEVGTKKSNGRMVRLTRRLGYCRVYLLLFNFITETFVGRQLA